VAFEITAKMQITFQLRKLTMLDLFHRCICKADTQKYLHKLHIFSYLAKCRLH